MAKMSVYDRVKEKLKVQQIVSDLEKEEAAYASGIAAALAGAAYSDNPFSSNTLECHGWRIGFLDAK